MQAFPSMAFDKEQQDPVNCEADRMALQLKGYRSWKMQSWHCWWLLEAWIGSIIVDRDSSSSKNVYKRLLLLIQCHLVMVTIEAHTQATQATQAKRKKKKSRTPKAKKSFSFSFSEPSLFSSSLLVTRRPILRRSGKFSSSQFRRVTRTRMPSATVDWPARRFVKSVFSATSGLKHSHSLNVVSVCVLEPMEEKRS